MHCGVDVFTGLKQFPQSKIIICTYVHVLVWFIGRSTILWDFYRCCHVTLSLEQYRTLTLQLCLALRQDDSRYL